MDQRESGRAGQQPPPWGESWPNSPVNTPDVAPGAAARRWHAQGSAAPPPTQPNQPNPPWYPAPGQAPYGPPSRPIYPPASQPRYGPPPGAAPGMPPSRYAAPPSAPSRGYASPPTTPSPSGARAGREGQVPPAPRKGGWRVPRWVITLLGSLAILVYGVLSGSLRLPTAATPTLMPAPGQGDHMALGANYQQGAAGSAIVQPKDSFHAKDSLAFVVSLDRPFGTTQLTIILVNVGSGGAESTVGSAPLTITNSNATQLADQYPTADRLMGNSPAGTYKLEVANGPSLLAQATFHYLG